jgi:hypothetical protein
MLTHENGRSMTPSAIEDQVNIPSFEQGRPRDRVSRASLVSWQAIDARAIDARGRDERRAGTLRLSSKECFQVAMRGSS